MVWPLGNDHPTVHPEMAVLPELLTVTSAWKPPGHELVTLYVAVHALPVMGEGLGDGEGDGEGDGLGEGEGDGDGEGDGEAEGLADGDGDGLGDGETEGLGDGEGSVPGALPQILVDPEYSVMFCTVTGVDGVVDTPVNDQSFDGSHVPALAMRNCTSRRDSDCPCGAMTWPEQSIVT
ncbi:hypothetical protein [Microbispora sp. H11081]|uniref:hypothetical protein n=1 Tax=Microbispora sp. H11081 TaxID=2729107 RepID=UPI0037C818F7